MRNFRILFSTPFSHFIHFIMLLLLCYGAHLVFWSGAVSGRNTRRAEHPAEARRKLGRSSAKAPRKLSSSTAMRLAAGSRSGYPLNFAFTLKWLETYDAQKHRNAWLMMETTMDAWIMNDDDDRNRDDRVVHRSTSSTINSPSLIIIFSFSSFAVGSFGRLRKCRFYWEERTKTRNPLVFLKGIKKIYHKLSKNHEKVTKIFTQEPPALYFFYARSFNEVGKTGKEERKSKNDFSRISRQIAEKSDVCRFSTNFAKTN